jgi:transcriptional regulator with XRE-family HTH domain
MSVWVRMQQLLEESGLSQVQLAQDTKLSTSAISRLQHATSPSAGVVISIASRFQVRPAWLLDGTGPKYEAVLTDTERELVELWRHPRISPIHRYILDLFRGILKEQAAH